MKENNKIINGNIKKLLKKEDVRGYLKYPLLVVGKRLRELEKSKAYERGVEYGRQEERKKVLKEVEDFEKEEGNNLKNNVKETLKYFLYTPFKIGINHRVLCFCGEEMKIKSSGSSSTVGDCDFECIYCGRKLFLVWQFINEFPTPFDKAEIIITKKENLPKKEKKE